MASAIASRRIRLANELSAWFARLSLRTRIAGTMLALVALAGIVLAAWAYQADERLKRSITYDLLSEELTHFEQRMRIDRGAEPLRSARIVSTHNRSIHRAQSKSASERSRRSFARCVRAVADDRLKSARLIKPSAVIARAFAVVQLTASSPTSS